MPLLCVLVPAPATHWPTILEALDGVSPLVEDAGAGSAYLEMHGIAGGPERWLATAAAALAALSPAAPVPAKLGVGPNKFVARAAAQAGAAPICTAAQARKLLAPLALALLELPPEIEERLQLLGVTTLGELAALPHGPFVRRFGPEAARWHDRARGIDDRPLIPRARSVRIERTLFGEGEAACEEQVLFALRTLVVRVVEDLTRAGKRAGALVLSLECENGDTHRLNAGVAQPTAQENVLFNLLRARLEGVRLESAVIGLTLAVERLESGGITLSLFAQHDPDPQALAVALARLEAAGAQPLRARVVDGHRPETRIAYEPFPVAELERPPQSAMTLAQLTSLQYRLLDPSEIDVVTDAQVPRLVGTPPQSVVHVCGPWRADETWWDEPLCRDDYDVLLEDGSLYRIARHDGHWYLYGVYD